MKQIKFVQIIRTKPIWMFNKQIESGIIWTAHFGNTEIDSSLKVTDRVLVLIEFTLHVYKRIFMFVNFKIL